MQSYIVCEFTRNANGNIAVYPSARESEDSAYGKYYEILNRAATSNSPVHGAMLTSYDGFPLEHKCFMHETVTTETTEGEGE